MDDETIEKMAAEFETVLAGRRLGRIIPLSRLKLAIDFRISDGTFLFICIEPGDPRTYLIKRRLKDLERQSANPGPFVLSLPKKLSGADLKSIKKIQNERVLMLEFSAISEVGETEKYSLAVQLTGRSANLFLLDGRGIIIDRLRETVGDGQEIASTYSPPPRRETNERGREETRLGGDTQPSSLSKRLDEFYLEKDADQRFRSRAHTARKKIKKEIEKRQKLISKVRGDLEHHGDAGKWKRFGDLLLANASNARRDGDKIFVTDFYDNDLPEIQIEAKNNLSITEAAEKYFKRYTKARNAAGEIAKRLSDLNKEVENLNVESDRLDEAIAERDESFFLPLDETKLKGPAAKVTKPADTFNGARSFISSDGFEILVGKKAKDNDYLTFRVAKSLDLWLHAADYPGSHVVVRNPNRKEIPPGTLLEAAQLAAFYSDAREQPKAAVNYTHKKFVNKPNGAAPGLVRLASFKTILVRPRVFEKK